MESQPLPFLMIDLIIQILSWLPVKSLVRFRCVSKSCNSLISQPSSHQLHLQHYSAKHRSQNILLTLNNMRVAPFSVSPLLQNPPSTISDHPHRYYYQLDTNIKIISRDSIIIGSCNGLVCLCDCSYYNDLAIQTYHEFLFWNPATRLTSKSVPPCYRRDHEAFNFRFGFGYDDSTHTYKLLAAFVTDLQPRQTTLQAYTMGCDGWRNISDKFPLLVGHDGSFVSGTLNWLALPEDDDDDTIATTNSKKAMIVSLDLRTETYKQLSLPDEEEALPPKRGTFGELRVMRESLCFFHDYTKTHFVLWQMKEFEDDKSWTRLVKIQIDGGVFDSPTPVCISDNGDVVMLENYITSEAILYNRRDNRVERTRIPKRILDVNDYVPSLVLPL